MWHQDRYSNQRPKSRNDWTRDALRTSSSDLFPNDECTYEQFYCDEASEGTCSSLRPAVEPLQCCAGQQTKHTSLFVFLVSECVLDQRRDQISECLKLSCHWWSYVSCLRHAWQSFISSMIQRATLSVWSTLAQMIWRFRDDTAEMHSVVFLLSTITPNTRTNSIVLLLSIFVHFPPLTLLCSLHPLLHATLCYFFPLFHPRTQTTVMFMAPRGSNLQHPPRLLASGLSLLKNDAFRFNLRQVVQQNAVIFRYESVSWNGKSVRLILIVSLQF